MKHRPVIGIEVTGDEVRGACVRSVGGTIQVAGVASAPLPSESIDAEGLLSASAVGEVIRRVCAQLDPRTNRVTVGLTGCNLVARVMEIPPVPDTEIRSVLRGEMDHYRILPAGQSAFDFYRLPDPPEKEGESKEESQARVLLMGAEERLVSSYRAAVDAANLNTMAVEPGSIAVLRAQYPLLRAEQAVATVMLSVTGTDIFITQQGNLRFYRRVDTGINELHAQTSGPVDAQVAPSLNRGSLLGDEGEWEEVAPPPSAPVPSETLNRQAISLLMTEVQRSIDYYVREFPTGDERMLVRIAIGSPDTADLFAAMQQYLRSEAELASVLPSLSVAPEASSEVMGPQGFRYTVAVGLALRGAGGEYAGAPALDLSVGDPVVMERRIAPRVMMASLAASGLILVGTVAAALMVGNMISTAERNLTQARHELTSLTEEHTQKVARLERQKGLVQTIRERDKPMREAIEFVSASVSRRACLTSLAVDRDGTIYLSGEAPSPRIVADIMDTINMSPVLQPIRLNSLVRVDSKVEGEKPVLKFDLQTGFLVPAQAAATPSSTSKPQGGA